MQYGKRPVKRRWALQECNPPRNSWLQTHQDDGTRDGAGNGSVPVIAMEHRIDRFAHASENSDRKVPLATTIGGGRRFWLRRFRRRQQTGLAPRFQPVTFSADVDRRRMMKQAVENGGSDDRVAEDRSPLAIAFVRSEDDTASFIAGADELKEDRRAQFIEGQISHLADDQHLGSQNLLSLTSCDERDAEGTSKRLQRCPRDFLGRNGEDKTCWLTGVSRRGFWPRFPGG